MAVCAGKCQSQRSMPREALIVPILVLFCNLGNESVIHILKDCRFAKSFWNRIGIPVICAQN